MTFLRRPIEHCAVIDAFLVTVEPGITVRIEMQ